MFHPKQVLIADPEYENTERTLMKFFDIENYDIENIPKLLLYLFLIDWKYQASIKMLQKRRF